MSVITQIKKAFSRQDDGFVSGIALRQQSIASCSIEIAKLSGDYSDDSNEPEASGSNLSKACEESSFDLGEHVNALDQLGDSNAIKGKCGLVLPASLSQIVQVDKPNVPDAEINAALKWQVKDLVSFSPDNMVLDYFDAPESPQGQKKINVVCSPLDELKKLVDSSFDNDINLTDITIEEFAFAKLVEIKDNATLLVCQQPNEEIVILIVTQGRLFFHRRLRGFAQIAQKSQEELEMGTIDSLSLEIQRSTDYFERQMKQAPIKEISILVPMENEAFLARKLAENTNVPVSLFELPKPYTSQRRSACSIGAMLIANEGSAA